jgi:hypothetical protein
MVAEGAITTVTQSTNNPVIPAQAGIFLQAFTRHGGDSGFRDCVIIADKDSSGTCHSGLDPESLTIACRFSMRCRIKSGMTDKSGCLNKLRHSLFRRNDNLGMFYGYSNTLNG